MNLENLSQHRILSISELMALTGKSRTTTWRNLRSGKGPRCLMSGARVLGVTVADYVAWVEGLRDAQS